MRPSLTRRRAYAVLLVISNAVLLAMALFGVAWVALGLAVFVPAVLAFAVRPQRGLLLLAALAPFNGLLIILPLPHAANGWKEALIIATLVTSFIAPASARGVTPGRRLPDWTAAVVGLMAVGIASAIAVRGIQAAYGMKILFFMVLVAVAVWRCPFDARERDLLVTILMVTGFACAVVGLLQQVLGHPYLHGLGYKYNETIRFSGGFLRSFSTFNQPFGYAFYLMLVVLIGLPHALSEPTRLRSQLFLLSLPIIGLGLVASFVRAAWLALGVGLAYLGSHRYRVLLLTIPLAMLGATFLPSDVSSVALSSDSAKVRGSVWQATGSKLVESPLGSGIGSSGAAKKKVVEDTGQGRGFQLDNYYYKIIFELGLIGAWLFVLLLCSAFASARTASRRLTGPDGSWAAGVAAFVVATAVACFAFGFLEIFPIDAYFWMFLGLVASCFPAVVRTVEVHEPPVMAHVPLAIA